MLRSSEHAEKAPEYELEAALCVLRRQFRDWWLLADDELQGRNEIHDELPVQSESVPERVPPVPQFLIALRKERADQTLKGLRQSGIRDVALVLVELARGKQAARRHQYPVQLVYDRGLADPGVAGHKYQLWRAAVD